MQARVAHGILAAAILAAGLGGLYAFHRALTPHRRPRVETAKPADIVRIGYFANITHAVPLLGLADGDFARALGPGVRLERVEFGAGPSAVEALFAGSIDMAYVGPNPALNAHLRSRGEVKVIAGAARGGAALVVRRGVGSAAEIRRLATPQLGNTQDVAARAWLRAQGLLDVKVIPLRPPDQLTALVKGEIDAAWTVEPWVSRLVLDAGGRVLVDERDLWPDGRFPTTLLVAGRRFVEANPDLVRRWLRAHVEVVGRLQSSPDARARVNAELGRLVGKPLSEGVLREAFGRMEPTWDPLPAALRQNARQAFELDYLDKVPPDVENLFDLAPLERVLREAGLPPLAR
ncbi:MAG TPA: ABC transporter substrate-binding protein [Planctomycetota bacterium]|nr:ABC transporter substrate-binding protein [Planctomycetota bacterium]